MSKNQCIVTRRNEPSVAAMEAIDKQVISTWQVVVYDNCVSFKRFDNGQIQEGYPPVPTSKAAVYAAAIVHGLQPPRDLRLCDKSID